MTQAERCVPGAQTSVSDVDAAGLAAMFKALGSPARLRLLTAIQSAPMGETCVCDLVSHMGMPQPTVSHHLGVLVAGGLIRRERRGTWAWYAVVPEGLDAARMALRQPGALSR